MTLENFLRFTPEDWQALLDLQDFLRANPNPADTHKRFFKLGATKLLKFAAHWPPLEIHFKNTLPHFWLVATHTQKLSPNSEKNVYENFRDALIEKIASPAQYPKHLDATPHEKFYRIAADSLQKHLIEKFKQTGRKSLSEENQKIIDALGFIGFAVTAKFFNLIEKAETQEEAQATGQMSKRRRIIRTSVAAAMNPAALTAKQQTYRHLFAAQLLLPHAKEQLDPFYIENAISPVRELGYENIEQLLQNLAETPGLEANTQEKAARKMAEDFCKKHFPGENILADTPQAARLNPA